MFLKSLFLLFILSSASPSPALKDPPPSSETPLLPYYVQDDLDRTKASYLNKRTMIKDMWGSQFEKHKDPAVIKMSRDIALDCYVDFDRFYTNDGKHDF
jgi:hypothetical protein